LQRKVKPKPPETIKAGALLCPTCCVEFREIEVDLELDGKFLSKVKILRCPICEEEVFTPEQYKDAISKKDEPTKLSLSR
jgi:hypothetical protein